MASSRRSTLALAHWMAALVRVLRLANGHSVRSRNHLFGPPSPKWGDFRGTIGASRDGSTAQHCPEEMFCGSDFVQKSWA